MALMLELRFARPKMSSSRSVSQSRQLAMGLANPGFQMDSWPCPEFRSGWDSYFKKKPDKPVMHYSVIAGWFGDHMVCVSPAASYSNRRLTRSQHMPPGNFFTMFHFLEYPFSRGETHIKSASPVCTITRSKFISDSILTIAVRRARL